MSVLIGDHLGPVPMSECVAGEVICCDGCDVLLFIQQLYSCHISLSSSFII